MITRFKDWDWEGVPVREYKASPIGAEGVTRRTLSEGVNGAFELRYFEVEPGGHTSHERHDHEHLVMVIRGQGRVLLDDGWHPIEAFDVVQVPGQVPHQFECVGSEPFGILCVVDRLRDRPALIADLEPASQTSEIR